MNNVFPILLLLSSFVFSCSQSSSESPSPGGGPTIQPELQECLTSTPYAPSVVVSGTAKFYKRTLDIARTGSDVTSMTLAGNSVLIPIQLAEVRVLNSSGSVIQCGTTNLAGELKALNGSADLLIPNAAGNFTIQVLARSNQALTGLPMGKPSFKIYASVKADIYTNEVHSINQDFSSVGVGTVTTNLIAYAKESDSTDVRGGAFNILNNIIITYRYLAQNTGTSNLSCLSPKLEVYWRAGFNPAQYIYPDEDPSSLGTLSFYIRGYNQLYINGGRLGNLTSQDTDHFDDAVIIHELGHRIEDVCGKMESPGGTHYGLYRIDPRLAWSEGFGNFLAGHIIRNNLSEINPALVTSLAPADGWLYYLDTKGYNEGSISSGSEYIRINLNESGANPRSTTVNGNLRYYDRVNSVANPGEGHFREISVARGLFKSTNTCTANCTNCSSCANANYFDKYWQAFENDFTGIGMGKSSFPFRSSIRFYSRLNTAFSGSMPAAINTILNINEAQQRDGNSAYVVSGSTVWVPYGVRLEKSVSSCSLKIQPVRSAGLTTDANSDQRFSNHFYYVDMTTLTGVTQINLTASQVSGSPHDIDLILYGTGYNFDEDCTTANAAGDCTAAAKSTSSDMIRMDRSAGLIKQISSMNTLDSAQAYLLNIRSFPTSFPVSASEYTYTLTDQSGGFLCPSSTF